MRCQSSFINNVYDKNPLSERVFMTQLINRIISRK